MKACVDTFAAGLNDLILFLDNADRETELVKSLLRETRQSSLTCDEKGLITEIAKAGTGKRQYVYAVAIIGLYGLLERLVDSILEKYIVIISGLVDRYDDLPESLRRNHVTLTIELVKAVSEERHRGDLTTAQIIANLHSCLSGDSVFRVNAPAFVLHRGNITLHKARDFLKALGIEASARRMLVMPAFETFFAAADPPRNVHSIQDADLERLLTPIDDLVERRNSVAHGIIDDIETVDLLIERCRFVSTFVEALYDLLQQEMLRVEILCGHCQPLGRPLNVFNDHIVCFESEKCTVAIGDRIVAATGDALMPFRWSAVINLEVDRTRHQTLDINSTTRFGAEVAFNARKNHDYFLLPAMPTA
jgi:hypothetical protein